METKELVLTIAARRMVNKQDLREMLKWLQDGKYLIIIKDFRRRSLPQNAYYWGVIVPLVRRGLYDNGFDEVTDNDTAHEVMKKLFLKKTIVSKQTGDMIDISGSSAALTVTEFNEFIESISKWAAEYLGIVIPSPNSEAAYFNEQLKMFEDEEPV
jgi:hypothetical protein